MLVADGMGGAKAGEVASRMAISVLLDLFLQTPDWILCLDEQRTREVLQRLNQRFRQVHEVLAREAQNDPALAGMGTTMTLAGSLGADLLLAHVGDSRAYLLRQGELHLLTQDDTVVQHLVASGVLRPEEAARHPLRHLLTRVIGSGEVPTSVQLRHFRLLDGDQVLLCSDGLTRMVADSAIADVLRQPGSAEDTCHTLVQRALDAGGKDNVTVILGRYHIPSV
jgi:protein phosphatase